MRIAATATILKAETIDLDSADGLAEMSGVVVSNGSDEQGGPALIEFL